MKKRIKLFSSALAIGMLLGTGVSAVTSIVDVQATTQVSSSKQNASPNQARVQSVKSLQSTIPRSDYKLKVDASNAEFDATTGKLTGFSQQWVDNNREKIQNLLNGGILEIPDTINGTEVTIIGEREVYNQYSGSGAFSRYALQAMIGENPHNESNRDFGISSVTGGARLTQIAESSFEGNKIETIDDMINLIQIDEWAFGENRLTTLNLSVATKIKFAAFSNNALLSIKLHQEADVEGAAFAYQNISHEVMPNKEGEIEFAALKPTISKGTDKLITAVSEVAFDGEESIELDNGVTLQADNANKKITGASHPDKYSVDLGMNLDTEGSLPGGYFISSYSLTVNPFKENPDGGGGLPGNGNNGNGTDTNPDSGNGGESGNSGNETKPQPAPKPEERRPHTVYAKRGMRLHRNVSLTSPIRSYKKQSRAKVASFRVRGIAYDKNGKKRYKVDGGYITAGASYVTDSHFRSNKVRQVRVLSNRVNSYKDVKLSSNKKVRSYKKGTKLRVKRVVNWGRATRFELTNGRYITGNKQLLIMDQK